MRAQSSVKVSSSIVVVMLALMSGCSPDEPRVVAVVPEPLAPEPELREPGQPPSAGPSQAANDRQELLNAIRVVEAHVSASRSDVLQSTPRKLVFECTDGVNFSVGMSNSGFYLFPPGFPPGAFLVLGQVPRDSGVLHYSAGDIDLRVKDDLATLEIGRERYVDCVSNPAAAVWQAPTRSTTPR